MHARFARGVSRGSNLVSIARAGPASETLSDSGRPARRDRAGCPVLWCIGASAARRRLSDSLMILSIAAARGRACQPFALPPNSSVCSRRARFLPANYATKRLKRSIPGLTLLWCATSTSHTLLLRVSGVTHNRAYDLEAVTGGAQSDGGVPHGRLLERRALIDRLYAENLTYAAIGRRLSVSKNTISRMSAPRAATTCRTPENSRMVAVGAENRLRKASKPAPNTPQTVHRGLAVPEPERRSETGIFRRRYGRGDHLTPR